MTLAEALEMTRIHRVAWLTRNRTTLVTTRPCRAPPHPTADAGGSAGATCLGRVKCPWPTTHLRPLSQEVFDGHEGLVAAKAKSGEPFLLRLSKYLTSL